MRTFLTHGLPVLARWRPRGPLMLRRAAAPPGAGSRHVRPRRAVGFGRGGLPIAFDGAAPAWEHLDLPPTEPVPPMRRLVGGFILVLLILLAATGLAVALFALGDFLNQRAVELLNER
jgi:hypothetical protein